MFKRLILLSLILVMGISHTTAQEAATDDVFFEMLSNVPASVADVEGDAFAYMSYTNLRALEAAREGVPSPNSYAEWEADEDAQAIWLANATRIQSPLGIPQITNSEYSRMSDVVGFDFFDIDRVVTFDRPPRTGIIYWGEFDAASIANAHIARDYTTTPINDDVTLWCGPIGCENGAETDVDNIERANIFGGDLGRQVPFYVTPDFIYTTPSIDYLNALPDLYEGTVASILARPTFLAGAEAISTGTGTLIQAQFLVPAQVGNFTEYFVLGPEFSQDRISELEESGELESVLEEARSRVIPNYQDLDPYELAILADRQEGDQQVALVALVFDSEEAARFAAEEVTQRIGTFSNFIFTRREEAFIEIFGGTLDEPRVYYSPAADRWVALASARYPLPSNALIDPLTGEPLPEDSDQRGMIRDSGLLFRSWIDALRRGTFTPLAITFASLSE